MNTATQQVEAPSIELSPAIAAAIEQADGHAKWCERNTVSIAKANQVLKGLVAPYSDLKAESEKDWARVAALQVRGRLGKASELAWRTVSSYTEIAAPRYWQDSERIQLKLRLDPTHFYADFLSTLDSARKAALDDLKAGKFKESISASRVVLRGCREALSSPAGRRHQAGLVESQNRSRKQVRR